MTETANSSRAENPGSRLVGLDVLRFLATSFVIISHAHLFGNAGALFGKTQGFAGEFLSALAGRGWTAVDVFFVLSGFLVSGLLFKEAARTGTVSPGRFLIRRGFKIYPAFWVMLAANIIWACYWQGWTFSLLPVGSELFYFQNYGAGICGHTWSLAVEEHFYFLLAGIFLVLKWRAKPGQRPDFRWIPDFFLAVAVACLVLRTAVWAVLLSNNIKTYWYNFADHALLDSLFFGMLLSHLWHNCWDEEAKKKLIPWCVPLALLGLGLLSPGFEHLMDRDWFCTVGFTFVYLGGGCLLLSSLSLDYFRRPIFVRWLAWLGQHSYSVYLWHMLTGRWLTPLLSRQQDNLSGWILSTLIYFTSCWIMGIVLGTLIEIPALRLRDRWFPSRA